MFSVDLEVQMKRGFIFNGLIVASSGRMDMDFATLLLLIASVLAGTCAADNNPVGTWDGVDGTGDAIHIIFYNDGTMEGTFEEDLSPDCVIYWDASGTYSFDQAAGRITFCFDDRKPCTDGIELRVDVCIDGYINTCDNASGTSSGTGYIYYNGSLVDQTPIGGTWDVDRVSVPLKADEPGPANQSENQSTETDLSWSNGGGACTYDVYFGTDSTPDSSEFKGNQFEITFDVGTLEYETTYYWRIDARNANGTAAGDLWHFTTGTTQNQFPVILSVTAASPVILDDGTSRLQVIASDPDSGPSPLSYNWILQEGQGSIDNQTSEAPIYTPPDITSSRRTFTITVEVSDGQGVTSSTVDITVVDAESLVCDFYQDGYVDFADYVMLASHWFDVDCDEPDWCQGADIDYGGDVNYTDLVLFCDTWLMEINAFLQDNGPDGIVSIEAENFYDNIARGSHTWTMENLPEGFSGSACMHAGPDIGANIDTGYDINSPQLDYNVEFVKTGTHYIWIRGFKTSGTDDSVHVGLDGRALSSCDRLALWDNDNQWQWSDTTMDSDPDPRAAFNVAITGIHTVNLWMREDGFRLDKIVITADPDYIPTGLGPQESQIGSGQPDTDPPTPDPMTWAVPPFATGSTSISMTAATAADISGVEYFFDCAAGGGHNSGWQDSPTYEDTGLTPDTQYTYTVKACDKSDNRNETGVSDSRSAFTLTVPVIYEAEDAALSGCVVSNVIDGYTGTGFVDYLNPNNDYIEWTVNVGTLRQYELQFRYGLESGDRPLEIKVNGQIVESGLSFPATGSWSTWETVSTVQILNAGINTVRATAIGYSGANLDHLKVISQ